MNEDNATGIHFNKTSRIGLMTHCFGMDTSLDIQNAFLKKGQI